jgi:hypothetical protein
MSTRRAWAVTGKRYQGIPAKLVLDVHNESSLCILFLLSQQSLIQFPMAFSFLS